MSFKEISAKEIPDNLIKMISEEWALLGAGDENKFNMMTVSWGFAGEIWGDDYMIALIRPQRYTMEFAENNDTFSLCFFGNDKSMHAICGHKSGRDIDKAAATGLTPLFSDGTVYFEQARLVIICRKKYVQSIEKDNFTDKNIVSENYGKNDFHRMFFGKIEKVLIKE